MLIFLLCAALALMRFAPNTAIGRSLRSLLVDAPARKLAALTPGAVLFGLMLVLGTFVVIVFVRGEMAFVLAQGLPEAIGWFVTFDVGTYLDVIVIAWLLSATGRLRPMLVRCRDLVLQVARRIRPHAARGAVRPPRSRRRRPRPPSDDGLRGWLSPAFA